MYVKILAIHTSITTVILAFGLFIAPSAQAAGNIVGLNEDFPITGTAFVPCANNGQGDIIQLSGVAHILVLGTVQNTNGVFLLHITLNGQDVTGVSTTTGVKYQGEIGNRQTLIGTVGVLNTVTISTVMVSQGSTAPNLIFQLSGHLTLNPNGTIVVNFDNENIRCM